MMSYINAFVEMEFKRRSFTARARFNCFIYGYNIRLKLAKIIYVNGGAKYLHFWSANVLTMRANIAKSSLFGWKWAINKMRNHVDCGWLQKEGFTQFHCREHVVIRISCIRLYNWVCRYKKIILKAKRNCNFNFRLLYGDALRCAVLWKRACVPYVCIVLHTHFVYNNLFHFQLVYFFYSIPFLLPAQHSSSVHEGLPMYVFFLSFIHSMNAMFICNRNHSRLMLYFANRLCWAQNFHIWLIFTWNRPNDWLSSMRFIT